MRKVPDEFRDEFDAKGETFFEIAALLYSNPDRQYTQDEMAEIVDRSNQTVSEHTTEMESEEWVTRQEDQTTFAWNTETHNPARTEGITAAKQFYVDCWNLVQKHSETFPGVFAMIGFGFFLTAGVIFVFFLGFSVGTTQESAAPTVIYLLIAFGSFITGVILTVLSPLQAFVNRIIYRIVPEGFLKN